MTTSSNLHEKGCKQVATISLHPQELHEVIKEKESVVSESHYLDGICYTVFQDVD